MIDQLFEYKIWADKRTLDAIKMIDTSRFQSSYSFALQQINHIVIVEELFKSRLAATPAPHKSTNTNIVPSLEELETRLIKSGDWYGKYVSRNDDGDKAISFSFADRKPGKMTVAEILFHILNHGSYHRGNIAHALDLASVPHPTDGYGIFIHEKEPNRRKT